MAKHAKPDTVNLADRLRPRAPKGDDLDAASAVLNDVLDRTASLQDGLHVNGQLELPVGGQENCP